MTMGVSGNQPAWGVARQGTSASGTYTVKPGDTLSGIAQKTLGDGNRWREIYDLNQKTIGTNPNNIRVGQKLTMPGAPQSANNPATPAINPVVTPVIAPDVPLTPVTAPDVPIMTPATPAAPAAPVTPVVTPVVIPVVTPVIPAPVIPPDSVSISQPNYPTVGDYVKKEFSETMDAVGTVMQGTAEVAFPPLLLGEIAAIKGKHEMNATRRIWDLPMDPAGKWKIQARAIMDEEASLASKEIAELPAVKAANIAAVVVRDGAVWAGGRIADGVTWVAREASEGAGVVWDSTVSGAKAIGNGVAWVDHGLDEADKIVARGFLNGVAAIGNFFSSAANAALPSTAPTPYQPPFN